MIDVLAILIEVLRIAFEVGLIIFGINIAVNQGWMPAFIVGMPPEMLKAPDDGEWGEGEEDYSEDYGDDEENK
jgi:hypothetical protein